MPRRATKNQAPDTELPKQVVIQEFGRRVHQIMLKKDWNQSDLARAAGIGRDLVSTYVRGRSFPERVTLVKLAKALGVTPEELSPNSPQSPTEAQGVEIKVLSGKPGHAWVRVNELMTSGGAGKLLALVEADKAEQRKKER